MPLFTINVGLDDADKEVLLDIKKGIDAILAGITGQQEAQAKIDQLTELIKTQTEKLKAEQEPPTP
jgi:hypothetical protein